MRIDHSRLPQGDGYVFTITTQMLDGIEDSKRQNGVRPTKTRLVNVSLITDARFLAYLRKNGIADPIVPQ
jgi:hypothetical protein